MAGSSPAMTSSWGGASDIPTPVARNKKVFLLLFVHKKKCLLVSSDLVFPCQRAFDEFDRAFDAVEGDEAAEAGAFHLAEQDLV